MPGILIGRNDMCDLFDENEIRNEGSFGKRESDFVTLCADQLKVAIEESRTEMDGLTEAAIAAGSEVSMQLLTRLQSVDRLMQRLWNVQRNLERFGHFLNSCGESGDDARWSEMLEEARATFTMENERDIFDAVVSGTTTCAGDASNDLTLFDD